MNLARTLFVSCLVVALPAGAVAQSAPPSATAAEVTVNAADRRLLDRGEYTTFELIGGGALGTFFGLGVGHAVQGRYLERGWIFTAGELGSMGVTIAGVASCADLDRGCNLYLVAGGMVGMLAFRTWEVIDVWAAPARHNQRVRRARARAERHVTGYVAPTGARGGVAGLALTF
jgi:hypothetical protein